MLQHAKTRILLIVFLILTLAILYANSVPYPGNKTFKAGTHWRPVDLSKGTSFRGLNTTYVFKQDYALQNISYNNFRLVATKDNVPYWINVTSGSNQVINVWQWFTDNTVVLEYTTTGTYTTQLYVGDMGEPTVTGADSATYDPISKIVEFTTSPSSSQFVHFTWNSYSFTFHGVFDESTGNMLKKGANVTAYFTDGTDDETFFVNGTYSYSTTHPISHFKFDLGETTDTVTQYGLNHLVYNGSSYYDIWFPQYEEDTDYTVAVSLTWNTTYSISNKGTSGCRVNFGTPPSEDEYISWYVHRTVKDEAKTREYWLSTGEVAGDIYIFDDDLTTYTFEFLDLGGVLAEHPYVYAQYYVNGTLFTVERRKVDVENKIQMMLVKGRHYMLKIIDGASYTFGDFLTTDQTTVTLTLRGVQFPKETLLTYKYVRIYAERAFGTPTGNITVVYEDTLNMTNSVEIAINYKNDTNAYNATETASSFVHVWSSAMNDTDYALVCTINHQRYGTYSWKQYFPRKYSEPPWGLDWLGSLPFDTVIIIPTMLILFAFACFSELNAFIGAFAGTVTAALLAYMGWISIPSATLIAAFSFTVLIGVIYAKRKVET